MKLEPGEVLVAQMPDGDRPLVDWRAAARGKDGGNPDA